MTQARTTAAEVMGSEVRDSGVPGRSLHHMPNGLGRDVVPPNPAVSADSAEDEAGRNPGGLCPGIHRLFDPTRHRNRSDVLALADQISHDPVLLPDLKIFSMQPDQLSAPETTSDKNREDRPVPLSSQSIRTWCSQ